MSEQELTRAILDALKARGIWCWRTNTGVAKMPGGRVRFGIVGGGDITGVLPGGRHFELEVKLPDGKWKVTPEQEAHGARIRALGGGWAVVRSVEEAIAAVTPTVTVSPTAVTTKGVLKALRELGATIEERAKQPHPALALRPDMRHGDDGNGGHG